MPLSCLPPDVGHDYRFHVGHDPPPGVLLVLLCPSLRDPHPLYHGGVHQQLALRLQSRRLPKQKLGKSVLQAW